MTALRYIKCTTKIHKFVIFSDSKSALQALLSKWDHPHSSNSYDIFSVLFILYIRLLFFVDYPVTWEVMEMKKLILQQKLHYKWEFMEMKS